MSRSGSIRRFRTSASRWSVCVAVAVVTALTLGATGNGGLKNIGHGVSADKIKVGIAIIDYDSISNFVDFARGDQQKTAQIFVDYINKNGGVGGRDIDPVYITYKPIPGADPNPGTMCTKWTEDDQVFAVLGVLIDMASGGQGILCITKEHNTVHIGHELEQPWIDESPPGLLLTPDTSVDSSATALLGFLKKEKLLKGKTVGIIADQSSNNRVESIVLPELKKQKVKTGSTAVLSITGTDTTAAQAQLDSFIEKWKTEGVDTIYMAGLRVSAKQFVEKIKAALPDALLLADSDSTAQQAQDEVKAGKNPNPYEGMLSVSGPVAADRWANKNPQLQQCVDIYEKATGTTVPAPGSEPKNDKGDTVQTSIAVTDFCGELFMFKTIAEKVGPNLTTKNWQNTVNKFGAIQLAAADEASLCKNKYGANDALGLVAFDSTAAEEGDWAAETPIQNLSGKICKAN